MKPYNGGECISGGKYDEATNTITWQNIRTGHNVVGDKVSINYVCFGTDSHRHGEVWMRLNLLFLVHPKVKSDISL